jgi:hypothetical protein
MTMDLSATLQAITTLFITQVLPGILGALAIIFGGSFVLSLVLRVVGAGMRRVKPSLIDLVSAALTAGGWILIIAGILQSLGLNHDALT